MLFNNHLMDRSEGQKQVLIMMRQEFVDEIDAHAEQVGKDRSSFIRDAVYAELTNAGVSIEPYLKSAPSRKGKGGPRKSKATLSRVRGDQGLLVADKEVEYIAKKKAN